MNVVKLALPDNGVSSASLKQLVLDNAYVNPKIDTTASPPHAGVIRLNWASSFGLAIGTIQVIHKFRHNYDYIPSVFGTFTFDNGSTKTAGTFPFEYGAIGYIVLDCDDTYVYLRYISVDGGIPSTTIPPFIMKARFYVMAERGA